MKPVMKILSTADIGIAIRNRRKSMNLSQHDLANRLAVTQRWISNVENGKDTVSLGSVLRVLAHLGLSLQINDRTNVQNSSLPSIDDLLD